MWKWVVLGVAILFCLTSLFSGCGGTGNLSEKPTEPASIGPAGGMLEISDPCHPLNGAKIEIPAGALDEDTVISVAALKETDLEKELSSLPEGYAYWGGIRLEPLTVVLRKPINVTLPNPRGATSASQLLVGQPYRQDETSDPVLVYQGMARAGSPIEFQIFRLGSFGVVSGPSRMGIVAGTFVNASGVPIPGGTIASSFSNPFIAHTDVLGHFELPAGAGGTHPALLAMSPLDFVSSPATPTSGMGITHIPIPPTLPTGILDVGTKIVIDQFDIPEPNLPNPCSCDPPIPGAFLASPEEPNAVCFTLEPGQTIRTHLMSLAGVYGGNFSPKPTLLDTLSSLWNGSMCVTLDVTFTTEDPNVARVATRTGVLTGVSEGDTILLVDMTMSCLQNCGDRIVSCPTYHVMASAPVTVTGVPDVGEDLQAFASFGQTWAYVGSAVSLQGSAKGGKQPYKFHWASNIQGWSSTDRDPTIVVAWVHLGENLQSPEYTLTVTDSSSPPKVASAKASITPMPTPTPAP